jgi:hypothetical protein
MSRAFSKNSWAGDVESFKTLFSSTGVIDNFTKGASEQRLSWRCN